MSIIYMVRHGRVAANPIDPEDPELSPEGQSQAQAVAQKLNARLPQHLQILTSPLRRCRQTAAPLAALWGIEPVVEARVAEVPGPASALMARDEWLRRALSSDWHGLIRLGQKLQAGYDDTLANWRKEVLEGAFECRRDAVIFSHFVPVNVLVGHALRSERVASFHPAHTSITVFEIIGDSIRVIERGRDMQTRVS
jgi:broad specificity phosphatase PhoE